MANASSSSEKSSFLLVTLIFGDPAAWSYARYTNLKIAFENHTSTPTMEVELPDNTGSLDDKEARLVMPLDDIILAMASNLPHSPIFLKVEEVTQGTFIGEAGSRKTMFRGRLTRSVRNYQGRGNSVALFAKAAKARLNVPLGLPCNHHCANALFSPLCGLNINDHDQFGQIATISGKTVTISTPNLPITAPTAPGGDNSRFWERGWLEKDGTQIGIHIWVISDPTVFVLRRMPPSDWLLAGAASIRFVPGCHKTIEDCRGVWDNEQGQSGVGGFNGLGYGMLPYNPLYQSPS